MTKHINVTKLPIERIPALVIEMQREQKSVESGADESAKRAFLELLTNASTLNEIFKNSEKNLKPLNLDQDDIGYAVYNILETVVDSLSAPRSVALLAEESALLADAKILITEMYPAAGPEEIFKLGYIAEWNAIEKMLSRAKTPENQARIERLGLTVMIGRLTRCHVLMGEALGIQSDTATPLGKTLAAFEKSVERLIVRTYATYDEETTEHQTWRATLLGAYDRQLDAYREEQRRKRKASPGEAKSNNNALPTVTD